MKMSQSNLFLIFLRFKGYFYIMEANKVVCLCQDGGGLTKSET